VGPRTFGFTEGSAGLNSGLFIASKLRIDNPEYIPFEKSGIHVKRGFFNFSLSTDEGEFMHIYTTHLEAFNEFPGPELRKQQLEQILNRMKENILKNNKKIGIVLCGDLNIPLKSNEPAEFLLSEHFIDSYNKINSKVTLENRTCLDFSNIIWKAKLDLNKYALVPEILDYAVLLKSHPELQGFDNGNFSIYTAVIPMNDEKKPLEALSDHHAEISLIQIEK